MACILIPYDFALSLGWFILYSQNLFHSVQHYPCGYFSFPWACALMAFAFSNIRYPQRLVSPLRLTYHVCELCRAYQVELPLDTDGLGLFLYTDRHVGSVIMHCGEIHCPACNTTANISQLLLYFTMLTNTPYHPFPCPRFLWILNPRLGFSSCNPLRDYSLRSFGWEYPSLQG